MVQSNVSSSRSSISGSTCSADSDDELGMQLAEEGIAPDAEAQLTANLLGSLFNPEMTIGAAHCGVEGSSACFFDSALMLLIRVFVSVLHV